MLRVPSAAGVMCRYTFDINLGTTFVARQLIRAQRLDFASWLTEIMARNRSTYVLGGQATLFRIKHLQDVIDVHERNSPWDPDAQVEDMELTWRLHEAGRKTLVSATARAYAGPMVTVKGLMGQRRKWDEGMAALLWQNKMPDKNTLIPWKQQFSMLANGVVRLLFAVMLLLALTVHQFVWSPIWLLPILVGVALNLKVAWRVPDRTSADLLLRHPRFPSGTLAAEPHVVDAGFLAEHLVRFPTRRMGRAGRRRVRQGRRRGSHRQDPHLDPDRWAVRRGRHLVLGRKGKRCTAGDRVDHRLDRWSASSP